MDISALTKDERAALATDATTDPATLAALSSDMFLLPSLVANPSTPPATLSDIYRDFPHLRPEPPSSAPPLSEADAALASFRQRQQAAAQSYARSTPAQSYPVRSGDQYARVIDSNGATILVPMNALRGRTTNGLAIASFIVSVLGLSLVGVVLGHVAKTQIAERGDDGEGFATAGLVIGYLSMAIGVIAFLAIMAS